MAFLESLLLVVHIGVAVTLCGLVLLQHGKGADMGAAFGSGSSGSSGSGLLIDCFLPPTFEPRTPGLACTIQPHREP